MLTLREEKFRYSNRTRLKPQNKPRHISKRSKPDATGRKKKHQKTLHSFSTEGPQKLSKVQNNSFTVAGIQTRDKARSSGLNN